MIKGNGHSQYTCEYAEFIMQLPGTYLERLPRDMVKAMLRPMLDCSRAHEYDLETISIPAIAELADSDIDCTNGKRQCVRGTINLRQWFMCTVCRDGVARIA